MLCLWSQFLADRAFNLFTYNALHMNPVQWPLGLTAATDLISDSRNVQSSPACTRSTTVSRWPMTDCRGWPGLHSTISSGVGAATFRRRIFCTAVWRPNWEERGSGTQEPAADWTRSLCMCWNLGMNSRRVKPLGFEAIQNVWLNYLTVKK